MGSQLSSGKVTATVQSNVGLGIPLLAVSASRNSAGSTAIATVGAGKVWRIYSVTLYTGSYATVDSNAIVTLDGVPLIGASKIYATAVGYAGSPASVLSLCPNYVELAATKAISLVVEGAGTQNWTASVTYQEVTL